MEDLPGALREARRRLMMTQAEFAALLGCSRRALQAYESGSAQPRAPLRRRIAALLARLDVDLDTNIRPWR